MLEEHISIAGYTGNMKPKAPPVYAFRGQKAHGNHNVINLKAEDIYS